MAALKYIFKKKYTKRYVNDLVVYGALSFFNISVGNYNTIKIMAALLIIFMMVTFLLCIAQMCAYWNDKQSNKAWEASCDMVVNIIDTVVGFLGLALPVLYFMYKGGTQ